MLEKSRANLSEANVDGTKLPAERQDLDGAEAGKKAAAAAKSEKGSFPGRGESGDKTQPTQGAADQQVGDTVEDLDSEEDGKKAAAKASYAGGLTGKGGQEGAAPNFTTTTDGTKVINKASSKGNVDGVKLEDIDLGPIFGDADLSEEFKDKATSLFEAVVTARVNHEFQALQETYDAELAEEVAEVKAELVEKIDAFLSEVVSTWVEENQVSIEAGLRTEIAENFINNLKGLFKESYIEVPTEKYNVIEDLESQVQTLQAQLAEQATAAAELAEQNEVLQKEQAFASVTEGLADTEIDKLKSLAEGVEFGSEELFKEKLSVIKENYFPKATKTSPEKVLFEQTQNGGNFAGETNSVMSKYVSSISKTSVK